MKQVVVNSLLTAYEDVGVDNPAIIFLHGWGGDRLSLKPLWTKLSSSYRTLSLDLPGFGSSQLPPKDWKVGDYSSHVAAFVEKVGITDSYVLVGHSFGGRVIIKGVGEGVLSPAKTILIDAAGVAQRSKRNAGYAAMAKTGKAVLSLPGLKGLQAKARRKLYGSIGSTDYLEAGGMQKVLTNTISEDLSTQAAKVVTPTLLIWGEKDTETPLSEGQKLVSLMAGSKLEVLPGLGHFPFDEDATAVARLIERFLKQ